MPVDLLTALSSYEVVDDQDSEIAVFRTRVPWVGPLAYLHIIYKPAPRLVLKEVAQKLRMPPPTIQLLARHNGAHLFSGALTIFGVRAPGQLLNRGDPFLAPPFDIESENNELKRVDRSQFLGVAGYGFDGSIVCIDRFDAHLSLFRRDDATPLISWRHLDEWLSSEVARLSLLFDRRGKRLVDEAETVPRNASIQ